MPISYCDGLSRKINNGSHTVLDLGRTVKNAVQKQGMLAWQYNTIGVSDAITMGGEGQILSPNLTCTRSDRSRHAILTPNPRDHCRQYRNRYVRPTSRRLHRASWL